MTLLCSTGFIRDTHFSGNQPVGDSEKTVVSLSRREPSTTAPCREW
ncbi:MAG: hypothetical protein MK290_07465 [Pedosphaera sp.]|nr:hypothetical protein [Pedosphaera sp.]